MNTSDTGEVAELESMAVFKREGYVVMSPHGHEQAYDFVAEKNNNFTRVQSKSGRVKNGSIFVFARGERRMNRTERLARLLANLPPYEQFRSEDDERKT